MKVFPAGGRDVSARTTKPLLLAVIGIGILLRLQMINSSPVADELYIAWASRLPPGEMIREVSLSGHPPLYYLITHFWSALNTGEAWLRLVSLTAGIAAIWFTYQVGAVLFSRRTAILAAALVSLSPILVWYSQDSTAYSWISALAVLSLFLLVRCAHHGNWFDWLAYVFVMSAALFSHYFSIVLVVAYMAAYPLLRDKNRTQILQWISVNAVLLILFIVTVLMGPQTGNMFSFSYAGLFSVVSKVMVAPMVFAGGAVGIGVTKSCAVAGLPVGHLVALASIEVFLIFAVFIAPSLRRQLVKRNEAAVALISLMLIAGPVVLHSLGGGDTPPCRFYVWAVPPSMLLVSRILTSPPSPGLRKAAAACLLVGVAGLNLVTNIGGYGKSDYLGSVIKVIAEQDRAGDVLLWFPLDKGAQVASIYFDDGLPVAGGWLVQSSPEAAYFPLPGESWDGFVEIDNWQAERLRLEGGAIKERVRGDIGAAERVWLITDRSIESWYPGDAAIYDALACDWIVDSAWDNRDYSLKLYTRQHRQNAACSEV